MPLRLVRREAVVEAALRPRLAPVLRVLRFAPVLLFAALLRLAVFLLVLVRRAFTPAELGSAFAEAGIPVRIRRVFPYGLLAVAPKAA